MSRRYAGMEVAQPRQLKQLQDETSSPGAGSVSPRTLTRWRSQQQFAEALREGQRALFDQATGELRASALAAVRTLREVAEDRSSPPAVRVNGARVLLEQSVRSVELVEVEARLVELEQVVRNRPDHGGRRPV